MSLNIETKPSNGILHIDTPMLIALKNLHLLAVCRHWILSGGLNKGDGRQARTMRDRQGNMSRNQVLMIVVRKRFSLIV